MKGLIPWAKKHSALILTVTASAGVIFTGVLAVDATLKASKILDEKHPTGPKETIKAVGKYYIPPVVSAVCAIGCVVSLYYTSSTKIKNLSTAYASLSSLFSAYRLKTNELYGDDADKTINTSLVKNRYTDEESDWYSLNSNEEVLVYDSNIDEYITATVGAIRHAENYVHKLYSDNGYVSYADFYEGIYPDKLEYIPSYTNHAPLEEIGWSQDASNRYYGYNNVIFQHPKVVIYNGNGEEDIDVYYLVTPFPPTADYLC